MMHKMKAVGFYKILYPECCEDIQPSVSFARGDLARGAKPRYIQNVLKTSSHH